MSLLSDLRDLGNKIAGDFNAGNYKSLADDVSNGIALIGTAAVWVKDLLSGFGMLATAGANHPTAGMTKSDMQSFLSSGNSFIATTRTKTFAGLGSFTVDDLLAAFAMILTAAKQLWNIFHKDQQVP